MTLVLFTWHQVNIIKQNHSSDRLVVIIFYLEPGARVLKYNSNSTFTKLETQAFGTCQPNLKMNKSKT